MAILTPLPLADAQDLGREYGLDIALVEPLSAGSVNSNFRLETADRKHFFARLYEEQAAEGAARELGLLGALSAAGVPVSGPLLRNDGSALSGHGGKPFAIFAWLEGDIVCQRQVTPEHCQAVGRALAEVHLSGFDSRRLGPGRFNPSDMLVRLEHVENEAARSDLLPDVQRVRELFRRYVPQRDAELPHGIVHGDLFRDNVLWQSGKLVGLLDFESVFHGPLAYDIAVTIEAWCYADAFQPALVSALAQGYASLRRCEKRELDALAVEAALGCLRFATTRITDFSLRAAPGTPPARDFRRFLARLEAIEAGALEPALKALSSS
ncbi:MAG TPA: homoserine kinase [Polyangiaceae bacterium]|nr:homoserine kinase [Polyangiaceae bacterium]